MRLALTKNQLRTADIHCDEARLAKQNLQRIAVNQISIDHFINGRENGYQFLAWGLAKSLLTQNIGLTEINVACRNAMGDLLKRNGYRTPDDLNYFKHQ